MATLREVLQSSRAVLRQARELNIRAGEIIFPVPSRAQLEEVIAQCIGGARCARELADVEVLRLPPLDQDLVEIVRGDCPDSISLLGREVAVEYREGNAPRVILDSEQAKSFAWKDLPDTGVNLPGGRAVEIVVPFGWYDAISSANIPELKVRCAARANQSLWESWSDRPEIKLTDPASEDANIPPIIESSYGSSVVDGSPLIGFGAVALKGYRYYSSDPWFEGKWFQSREAAESARVESAAKLEEIRKEVRERMAIETARAEAEAVKETLRSLQSRQGWYELEYELQSRVDTRRWASAPSSLDEIQVWKTETEALIAEVETALSSIAVKREAEEQARREAEEARRAAEVEDEQKYALLTKRSYGACAVAKARVIDAFVTDCIALRGPARTAKILRDEAYAAYGRARRAESLTGRLYGVDHRGLDWGAGRDIELCADWAEHIRDSSHVARPTPVPPASVTPAEPTQVAASLAALQGKFGGGKKRR